MIELKKIVDDLKSSPLFNMSLSSKELFHSNFIAWIIENYPKLFYSKISDYFNFQDDEIIEVRREQANIDLTLKLKAKTIFIENKVKSSPNEEQLKNYRKDNQQDIFILLSLIKPSFNLESIGWKFLSYYEIIKIIRYIEQNITNKYHIELLKDYSFVLEKLVHATDYLNLDLENSVFDFYNYKYSLFHHIRMNDFYIKHIYNQLSIFIYNNLITKYDKNIISTGSWYEKNKHREGNILIQTSFQNGKGILHIEYVYQDDLLIGIMIDGQKYNQYVTSLIGTQNDRIEFANSLKNSIQWFNFNKNLNVATMRKEFNRFPNMLYRYAHIPDNMKINDLIEIIAEDINKIRLIKNIITN